MAWSSYAQSSHRAFLTVLTGLPRIARDRCGRRRNKGSLSGGRAFAPLTTSSKRLLCSFIYSPDRGKSLLTPLASDYRPHYPHPSKVAITHANFRCTKERIVIHTRPVSHTRVDAAPAHPRPGRKATNGSIDILILYVARTLD